MYPEPLFVAPIHVDVDMTNACNLACEHCHAASGKRNKDELSTDEFKNLFDRLHQIGVINLTIAGGEPFTRPDIVELLGHLQQKKGMYVNVVTNGTFFSQNKVAELTATCPDASFNISIDGSTPQKMDKLRHRVKRGEKDKIKLYEDIVFGAKRASEAGLKVGVSFVVTEKNYLDIEEVYNLAVDEIGALDVTAIRFFPGGFGKEKSHDLTMTNIKWFEMMKFLHRQKENGNFERLSISVAGPWEIYLPLLSVGYSVQDIERVWGYSSMLTDDNYAQHHDIGDPSAISDLNINYKGEVYPGVLMSGAPKVLCGDIRSKDIKEIWCSSNSIAWIRNLSTETIGSPCNTCEIKSLCGAGSRARALSLTGDLLGLDEWCPVVETIQQRKNSHVFFKQ